MPAGPTMPCMPRRSRFAAFAGRFAPPRSRVVRSDYVKTVRSHFLARCDAEGWGKCVVRLSRLVRVDDNQQRGSPTGVHQGSLTSLPDLMRGIRQRQLATAESKWNTPSFLFRSSVHEIPHCAAGSARRRPVCRGHRVGCESIRPPWLLRALVLCSRPLVLRCSRTELLRCAQLLLEQLLPSPLPQALPPQSALLQVELLRPQLLRRCSQLRCRSDLRRCPDLCCSS